MKLSREQIKRKIDSLRQQINEHNRRYYMEQAPSVSDFEYDILMSDLKALEDRFPEFASPDSPTVNVGSDLSENSVSREFRQVTHSQPMLSLSNTYDKNELIAFGERIRQALKEEEVEYVCELKIDGSAISLIYRENKLSRAVTRGDGTIGEDVTANIRNIAGIPSFIRNNELDGNFEIRGEIFMPWDHFDTLNRHREMDEEPLFANPRNAAAGSLKLLDHTEVSGRGLQAILYNIIGKENEFSTHSEALAWAKNTGFPVSEHTRIFDSIHKVVSYLDYWENERKKLPYPTDGVVVKVNNLHSQVLLGYTSKSPRWATAYKFKPEQAITRLLSVDYQTGRTGAVTPVANLEPVILSGTVVKRASLHNFEQMKLLDIRIGDYLFIEKGGEIIPKVTGVDIKKREPGSLEPVFPERCPDPDCNSILVKDDSEAKYYCPNFNGCPTQIKARFIHFTGRKSMNILAGEATIEQLYRKGYISRLPDIYKVSMEQLLSLDGWKKKSAERFLTSVRNSLKTPFHKVIFALGIRFVGETTAKNIAVAFGSIDRLIIASKEDLLAVEDIGETIAGSLIEYLENPEHLSDIEELRKAGVNLEERYNYVKSVSDKLSGKTIVVSGIFSIPREEIKRLIQEHSGKNSTSVSSATSIIVAGEGIGPSKLAKAGKLGIPIINENDFMDLIK